MPESLTLGTADQGAHDGAQPAHDAVATSGRARGGPAGLKPIAEGLRPRLAYIIAALGFVVMAIPTFGGIARVSWSTEEGAHGPIVLAIAVWLFFNSLPAMRAAARPGQVIVGFGALAATLTVYVVARIVGSITIESFALYATLLAVVYLIVGARGMRAGWFALAYFLFVLPPPGSVVAAATQPLRLGLSEVAIDLLHAIGYPVARVGLTIFVDQYELLVKAACSGLNSMISLSAVGLFYVWARHQAQPLYCLVLVAGAVAMAIVANFLRIIGLVLIAYYLGITAAQGFLHEAAGLLMFVVAISGLFLLDEVLTPLRLRMARAGR